MIHLPAQTSNHPFVFGPLDQTYRLHGMVRQPSTREGPPTCLRGPTLVPAADPFLRQTCRTWQCCSMLEPQSAKPFTYTHTPQPKSKKIQADRPSHAVTGVEGVGDVASSKLRPVAPMYGFTRCPRGKALMSSSQFPKSAARRALNSVL